MIGWVVLAACGANATRSVVRPVTGASAKVPVGNATSLQLPPVQIEYMLRGYFEAGGQDVGGLGGHARSDNPPVPFDPPPDLSPHELELALVDAPHVFAKRYAGIGVELVNRSSQPLYFEAQDGRLSMTVEAIDVDGAWKPIENLPSSFCGNSYHTVELPPGHGWRFVAPRYAGPLKTKLRVVLHADSWSTEIEPGRRNAKPVYSTVFDGGVHPKQFTDEQGHQPTNIMDPYFE